MFKTQNMLIKKTLSNWQFLSIIFTALIYCNLLIWSRNIDMNIGIWNFCCTTSIVQYKRMIHQVSNAHSIAIFLNKNKILWVSFHSWVIFFQCPIYIWKISKNGWHHIWTVPIDKPDKLDKFGQTDQPLERKCLEKR